MWNIIIQALLKELESNPDRVFSLLEEIIELLKSHPEALTSLIKTLTNKAGGQ